jgi:fumarylacetoacetase
LKHKPENKTPTVVSKSNFKHMYWTMSQQLTHHTSNGCRVNSGDMMGSGTISGPPRSFSMLELTWGGKTRSNDGTERKFINDNDTVIMKGFAKTHKYASVLRSIQQATPPFVRNKVH